MNLRHFHDTSPLHSHGGLGANNILISVEGKSIFYPFGWEVAEAVDPRDSDDADSCDCQMTWNRSPNIVDDWFWPESTNYRSIQACQYTDIWEFGSIFFQIMTAIKPLSRYRKLAEGRPALGYHQDTQSITDDYWRGSLEEPVYQARYETAVSLLLDTIESDEGVKAILKGCWALEPQERPPIRVIVEQLEVAVAAAGGTQ